MRKLRMGFIVNPYAGIGGPAGQKGSDHIDIQQMVIKGKLPLRATSRAGVFIEELNSVIDDINVLTVAGKMGQEVLDAQQVPYELVDCLVTTPSTAEDTRLGVQALVAQEIDILIFVGGDGTARDVFSAIDSRQLVLGVPSGVKMHSGVFGITPVASAEIIRLMVSGHHVGYSQVEVCDIDEQAFRQGKVIRKCFGYMNVPAMPQYVQHVKQGGVEVEELVLLDIAADVRERLENDDSNNMVVFGPGSTTQFIKTEFGDGGTLLGVDVMLNGELILRDANAESLLSAVQFHLQEDKPNTVKLVVTAIGGQGHILGRGNQQFSPEFLRLIGRDNIWVVSTLAKLESLSGRPLQMDSNDIALDASWAGLIPVITGYRDERLYPLGLQTTGVVNDE